MEAAAIMRGEKTFADITYDYKKDVGNYYGKPIVRPNALAKACGVCDYGDDIALKMPAETLHVSLVMPRVANHAKILKIDYSEAEKMPGVVKVITAKGRRRTKRHHDVPVLSENHRDGSGSPASG